MLNAILSIAGSSHQGHERFSENSRGRQLCFMSFSALCVSFKGEHSPQYDYFCSHCVSKNSLSIWRTLIPRFLSVILLLHHTCPIHST